MTTHALHFPVNKPPPQLHYGFYDSFRLLSHGTTLGEDWRALLRNGTCDPSVALITGHSLGGAFVVFAKILGCESHSVHPASQLPACLPTLTADMDIHHTHTQGQASP